MAIKVSVSEIGQDSRELRMLRVLSVSSSLPEAGQHVLKLLDDFMHAGPNGNHACLVLELLGPNVSKFVEERFPDGRMPGVCAKEISRQALLGLAFVHQLQMGHGGRLHGLFSVSL